MKTFARTLALAAILAPLLFLAPRASAGVHVGIGIGGPAYYGPGPGYYGGDRYWVPGHWEIRYNDRIWIPGHWVYADPAPYYGYGGPSIIIGGGGWHGGHGGYHHHH